MYAVVEDVECDLGRCVGIDAHRPNAANDWCLNWRASTVELSAVKSAAVRLCAVGGCERIGRGHEQQTRDNVSEHSLFGSHKVPFRLGFDSCFPQSRYLCERAFRSGSTLREEGQVELPLVENA